MNRILLLFTAALCFAAPIYAQNTVDSLHRVLLTTAADTKKVKVLVSISDAYYETNYDSSKAYAILALAAAQKAQWSKGMVDCYNGLGVLYQEQSAFADALANHKAALKASIATGYIHGIAAAYYGIGNVYAAQGNYPEALKNHINSLKASDYIKDNKSIALSYINIGNIYDLQSNYPEALKNYFASLSIQKKAGDKKGIAMDYNNIGLVYQHQKNYGEAEKNYAASLAIAEQMQDKGLIGILYDNIGNIYFAEGDYTNALKNYTASLQVAQQLGDKDGIARSYIDIGDDLEKQQKHKEAEQYCLKGRALAQEIGSMEYIKSADETLSEIYANTGRYAQSLESYKTFIALRDSMFSRENTRKVVETQVVYDFEKQKIKDEEDAKRAELLAKDEEDRKELMHIVGIAVFIVILFSTVLLLSRRKVHGRMIDMLGTFSVLIVFEFLELLLHPRIEALTHNNLSYALLCSLLLASIIIPTHHRIEHWMKKKVGLWDEDVKKEIGHR